MLSEVSPFIMHGYFKGVVRMESNQRCTEGIDYEAQDTSLLLRQGEIENGKQEKTHLCRKEV